VLGVTSLSACMQLGQDHILSIDYALITWAKFIKQIQVCRVPEVLVAPQPAPCVLTYLYLKRSCPSGTRNKSQKQNNATRRNKKKLWPFRSGWFRFYPTVPNRSLTCARLECCRNNGGPGEGVCVPTHCFIYTHTDAHTLQDLPFPLLPTNN
jgi:hypothetical protein